jgi:site-specific recombinase XerD
MLAPDAQNLDALVNAFFGYLQRRRKAPATVLRWRPELRRFVEWAGERSLAEITAKDLEFGFLAAWEDDFRQRNKREPSPNSMRATIQAISSFYNFLERFDFLVDAEGGRLRNPARVLEAPQVRPAAELDWLRQEEDEALLGVQMNERERIAVFFLRMTGLRLAEALSLLQRDVDLDANTINVRSSKSDAGFRPVPISPELRVHIKEWVEHTKASGLYAPDLPFFVTRNRTEMKPQYIEMVLDRVGQRAGLSRKVKPHTLRRTFGSYLLNRGARLEVVSRLLGHASTAITEKAYARLEDSTIRAEMMRALSA